MALTSSSMLASKCCASRPSCQDSMAQRRADVRQAPSPAIKPRQAAIASVYAKAAVAGEIDWGKILELYDDLLAINPSPVVALNRAVAVTKVNGGRPHWKRSTRCAPTPNCAAI